MRNFATLLVTIVFCLSMAAVAHADIPRTLHFQGYLADESGNHPPDTNYVAFFSIWTDSASGDSLWGEQIDNVKILSGLYSVTLGLDNPVDINANQQLWLYLRGSI